MRLFRHIVFRLLELTFHDGDIKFLERLLQEFWIWCVCPFAHTYNHSLYKTYPL